MCFRAPTAATCWAGRWRSGASISRRPPAPHTRLLRVARELLPGVSELEIEELSVGLRPGTPDNAPAIGPGALEGLTWASGPLPERHPPGPAHGRAGDGSAREPGGGRRLPGVCDPLRFAAAPRRPAPSVGAVLVIVLTARASTCGRARRWRPCSIASASRSMRGASPWPSTARSSPAPAGGVRAAEDARVEVLTAMQGG